MNLDDCLARLTDNACVIECLTHPVSPEQARWKPAPDRWSILEVVNHLYDEERDDFRARLDGILHRPDQPVAPIDPPRWAVERKYNERELGESLDKICREVDQPMSALVADLKRRGMLDDTLVVWGGEFGRTPQGEPREMLGRDHHIEAFTMWVAGGGTRPGITLGGTDELGYYTTDDPVHVHDLQATILHLMGLDHLRLTYRFQGRDFRLTDVGGHVVAQVLA